MSYDSKIDDEVPIFSLKDYRQLGNSGLYVSPLALGTMNFGNKWDGLMPSCTKKEAQDIFDSYVKAGGNHIDTSNMFQEGQSEEWIGDFMKRLGGRDDLVLATKYSLPLRKNVINATGNSRKNMMQSITESLDRLRTSYIDIYYVHFWSFTTPEMEIIRALDDLIRSGKVHYIAVSDTPAWEVSRMNTIAEHFGLSKFIAYQGRHNIGDRDLERDVIPMCQKMGLGVVPWSALGQGKFTGRFRKNGFNPSVSSFSYDNGSPKSKIQHVEEKISEGPLSSPVHQSQNGSPSNKGRNRTGVKMTEKDYEIAEVVYEIADELGRSPSQVVLNWEMQQPGITSTLIGIRTINHLRDNLKSMEFTMSAQQMARLNTVSKTDLGFPHNFIGTSYETCPWVKFLWDK